MNADDDRWEHSDHGWFSHAVGRISSICSRKADPVGEGAPVRGRSRASCPALPPVESTAERTGPRTPSEHTSSIMISDLASGMVWVFWDGSIDVGIQPTATEFLFSGPDHRNIGSPGIRVRSAAPACRSPTPQCPTWRMGPKSGPKAICSGRAAALSQRWSRT